MIGVASQRSERRIVSEFFELFKTPWEFYRSDEQYDVLVCTSDNFGFESSKLIFIFSSEVTAFDEEQEIQLKSRPGGVVLQEKDKRLPIYGSMVTFPGSHSSLLLEETAQQPAALVIKRGDTVVVRVGYNLFEEIEFLFTTGQPISNASIPALEEHIALLRDFITLAGIPLVEIPPIPGEHKFIACLTHDIDHPALRNHWCDRTMFGFLYRSTVGTWLNVCRSKKSIKSLRRNSAAAFLLPFVHLGIANDFWWDFDRYLEIEKGHMSTFFAIPRSGYSGRTSKGSAPSSRACRYDIHQLSSKLKRLISAGCEVGVHGLDAWRDIEEARGERDRVSKAIGATELGVRMHWLFFDHHSPAVLERAGFTYDSTVGFRETIGYRAGTTQVYVPPGATNLFELPLHVMDTALFYPSYLNLSDRQAKRLVWGMIDNAERIGGVLTINWHDRSIAPERLWDDFYRTLLRELESRNAWFPTATQAVAWFAKRRRARIECARMGSNLIRVRGRSDTTDALPSLRIRIHKPQTRPIGEPAAAKAESEFIDVTFDGTKELYFEV